MKEKTLQRWISACLLALALLPMLGALAAGCFDLEYSLTCGTAYAAALAIFFAIALFLTHEKRSSRLLTLLFPICFMDGLLLIARPDTRLQSIIVIAAEVEALILSWNAITMRGWKQVLRILYALLTLLLCGLHLMGFFMYDFGTESFQSVPSSDGMQIAELRIVDEGALGGNTLLTVRMAMPDVQLLFGRFRAKPKELYSGGWTQAEKSDLYWTEDGQIIYNGAALELEEKER